MGKAPTGQVHTRPLQRLPLDLVDRTRHCRLQRELAAAEKERTVVFTGDEQNPRDADCAASCDPARARH